MVLLTLLAVVTVAIARQRSLFGVAILSGIYGFLMASVLVVLDAVDVAMTEASVGAGVSLIVILATLQLTRTIETRPSRGRALPLMLALTVGGCLVAGTFVLPPFGASDSPIHRHVVPRYLSDSIRDTNVPNVVTSILTDYRSYDTLGEVTVIFTAGIGVMVLLLRPRRRHDNTANGRRDR